MTLVTNMAQGWGALVGGWCSWQRSAGTPETTLTLRRYYLQRIARDLADRDPLTLTADDLATWMAGHTWSPATLRTVRSSLRGFYGWLRDSGRISSSPAHLLPRVRLPRAKPRPTPDRHYRLALATADERTRLAIQLAGQCGLRRGEIARARREDLEEDLLGWSLRVVGKGGHVRVVPLPDDVAASIREHPDGWLFPSRTPGQHLTPHYLSQTISRALGAGYTTHTLRHRAGTAAYAGTHDLRAVQEMLGHAKPETTAIYTEVPGTAIRQAVAAAAA